MSSLITARHLPLYLAAAILVIGQGLWRLHDSVLLAAAVLAAGLLRAARRPAPRVAALFVVGLGLAWSSVDPAECSAWWRGRLLYEKLAGHLPFVTWSRVGHQAFAACASYFRWEAELRRDVQQAGEKIEAGRTLELYRSPLGSFWIPAPGRDLMAWLVFELTRQQVYENGAVGIRPGDIVIDGGAHVGTFTRYALQRGAARVIAIEPEPINIACLEANLAPELASGKVHLIKAGIWDQRTSLALSDSHTNSAGHSFVRTVVNSEKLEGMLLVTLDEMVAELALDRVDFIKMDIEGAERRALAGAQRTLRQFHPRLAISSYHMHDDPETIPAVVRQAQPGYHITAKDFEIGPHRWITKVLFFE
jgi:FkbM family methyltransferase